MNHIRSTRLALVALALVVAPLAACGSDDDAATTTDAPTTAAPAETAETTGEPADTTATPAAGDTAEVTVKTFQFAPDPLVVKAGTMITFTNMDKIDHTVTAGTREAPTPDVFDGQLPEQGATFELTLDEPGTYDYFCAIHPGGGMTASITVE